MILLPQDKPFRIGRSSDNDLVFQDPTVSRHHASIIADGGQCFIFSDTSSMGSWLGTERIQTRKLISGDLIRIGIQRIRFSLQDSKGYLEHLPSLDASTFLKWDSNSSISIGRSSTSNIYISHPLCPKEFVRVSLHNDKVHIRGIKQAFAKKTASIPCQYHLPFGTLDVQREGLEWLPNATGLSIEAKSLGVMRNHRQVLSGIGFQLAPGELLAIVGRSGHGKSTLLRCLAGQIHPEQGQLIIPANSQEQIAWLQQDAPLYPYLTVEESIHDACVLRLPKDTSTEEIQQRIDILVHQLGLELIRKSENRSLSGGEQRRVALACELVASPGLVLLDEPFAGLDPVNVKSMASWFRQLGWAGHTVVLTTHDYAILPHVDKVLILHQGQPAFFGSPQSALKAFELENPEDLLAKLETNQSSTATGFSQVPNPHTSSSQLSPAPLRVRHRSPVPVLFLRFQRTLWRDRGRLAASILQPLVIGAFLAMLFKSSSSLWIAAFALNLCMNWFGMSGAIREVVAHKSISEQEWMRGLSPLTDLCTKWFSVFLFALLQSMICAKVLQISLQWHGSFLLLLGICASAIAAPVAAGLAASALARSPGQANAMLPLLLIPQVMFAGALVPLDQMSTAGQWISNALWCSWSQSALQDIFTENPLASLDLAIPALTGFGIVILCAWVLKKKATRNIRSISTKNTM